MKKKEEKEEKKGTLKLGAKAKDIITGFEGILLARHISTHNSDRWGIAPQTLSSDGKPTDMQFFDVSRVQFIEDTDLEIIPCPEQKVFLGCKVKDLLSDFKGTVSGVVRWASGCIRIGVTPSDLFEGVPVEEQWFPMTQLKITAKSKEVKTGAECESNNPGGPMRNPTDVRNPR